MKYPKKKQNPLFLFLSFLTLVFHVGFIGCGSSESAPRTSNLTTLQQQQILDTAQATIGPSSSSSGSPTDATQSLGVDEPFRFPAGLVLQETRNDRTTTPCDRGSVNTEVSAGFSGTITATNCVTYEGTSSNPLTDFNVNGSISVRATSDHKVSFSYTNFTMTRGSRSCSLAGTVDLTLPTSESSTVPMEMSLTSTCNGTTIHETGTVVLSESSSHLVANGMMTFTVGDSAPHDCILSNFNVETPTCVSIAQACRFPASVCTGDATNTNISERAGSGGNGGTGGSEGNRSPRLVETNPSQGNFCSFHESLIGEWRVQDYSYYRSPKLKFEPARLFFADFGGAGVASGTYEVIAADRIKFHVASTSTLDVLPANANVDGTVRITDGSLQLIFDESHSYRFPYHYSSRDSYYGDSSSMNPYRIDQKCTMEDHHLPELASNPSCTTEVFQGDWYYLLPIFDGRYSADKISFSRRQMTSTGSAPVLLNNLAFDWKVYHYLPDSDSYSLGEDYLGLPGNIVVSSDHVEFEFINSESFGVPFGTRKSFSFRSTSPYLSLTDNEGQTIFLGRSYSRNNTQKSRQEDGICEGTPISGCPASSLAGGWRLGSYYKKFHAGQPVKFSRDITVPIFDRTTINADGTLRLFRDGTAGETFFYQIVEGCYGCTAGQNWSLQIARERSQLPSNGWTYSPTSPKLEMTVTPNSLYLHTDGYDDSNNRWSEDLVFEKEETSSSTETSLRCVMRM